MAMLDFEHSRRTYWLDFAFYASVSLGLAVSLLWASPLYSALELLLWVGLGLCVWSFLEYLIHRFVLHGLAPFRSWHAQHHSRPAALISAPVLVTAGLYLMLALLTTLLLGVWPSVALNVGLTTGYLLYGLTHHAVHHATHHILPAWLSNSAWLRQRRHYHALHHRVHHTAAAQSSTTAAIQVGCCYGVTTHIWDNLLSTNARGQR